MLVGGHVEEVSQPGICSIGGCPSVPWLSAPFLGFPGCGGKVCAWLQVQGPVEEGPCLEGRVGDAFMLESGLGRQTPPLHTQACCCCPSSAINFCFYFFLDLSQ